MIPFQQLNIAPVTQEKLTSNDVAAKMLLAQGRGCTSDEEILAVCMLLSQDDNSSVAALATSTLSGWSGEKILAALGRQTHGKLLEFVVEFLPAHRVVDEYIFQCPNMNLFLNCFFYKLLYCRMGICEFFGRMFHLLKHILGVKMIV